MDMCHLPHPPVSGLAEFISLLTAAMLYGVLTPIHQTLSSSVGKLTTQHHQQTLTPGRLKTGQHLTLGLILS